MREEYYVVETGPGRYEARCVHCCEALLGGRPEEEVVRLMDMEPDPEYTPHQCRARGDR